MELIKMQGHAHQKSKALSQWMQIGQYYEEHGAKETYEKFGISRPSLYYIIKQLNKIISKQE